MDYNYILMDIILIVALFLMQFMMFRSGILDKRQRRIFSVTIYVFIAAALAQIGTTLTDNTSPDNRILSIFFNSAAFILSPFIAVFFSFVFSQKRRFSKIIYSLPGIINAIFVFLSPKFGLLFWVDEQNRYSRGPCFIIYIIAYLLGFFMIAVSSRRIAMKYQFRAKIVVYLILGFVIAGTAIQVIWPNIHTTTLSIAFAFLLYYALLCEQSDRFDIQTGLLNRRTFEQELARLKKANFGTLIIFDVDNFKFINDTYGHMFGDCCLSTLAQPISQRFEDDGYSFRIGGDEFCTLCFTDDEKRIQKLLKLVIHDVDFERKKDPRIPRLSYGYKIFSRNGSEENDIEKITREADIEMYKYKRNNKNIKK